MAWCRYESGKSDAYYDSEKVCIDFKDRRDFLHSIIAQLARGDLGRRRQLPDARRGAQAVPARHSGDAYQDAEYRVDKESAEDRRRRLTASAPSSGRSGTRPSRRVLWVAEGCRGHPRRGRPAPRPAEFLSLPAAGLRHGAARLADPCARRAAVQGPARGNQSADRAHPRAVRRARGQGLLPGRRRRAGRRGAGRGA